MDPGGGHFSQGSLFFDALTSFATFPFQPQINPLEAAIEVDYFLKSRVVNIGILVPSTRKNEWQLWEKMNEMGEYEWIQGYFYKVVFAILALNKGLI